MKTFFKYGPYIIMALLTLIILPLFYIDYRTNPFRINYISIALIYIPVLMLVLVVLIDIFDRKIENKSILQKMNFPMLIALYYCSLTYVMGIHTMSGLYFILPLLPLAILIPIYYIAKTAKLVINWKYYVLKYLGSVFVLIVSIVIYIYIAYL
jgi:hypothetical protein